MLPALYQRQAPFVRCHDRSARRRNHRLCQPARRCGGPGHPPFLPQPARAPRASAGRAPLRTRPCPSLSAAVVSTTHPWGYFNRAQRAAFEDVCNGARMSYFGGDCYGYALLAMGFIDVIVEGRLAPWDVAALIPVI